MKLPSGEIPRVSDILEHDNRRKWTTKSNATLRVLAKMPLGHVTEAFLTYDKAELSLLPEDIRGLRYYSVRGIKNGFRGGGEFHRVRREQITALDGEVRWECEDLFGGKRTFTLTPDVMIEMPPFIMHIYESQAEGSGLLVFCNTLFPPDNPEAHDTYSEDAFQELQGVLSRR